MECTKWVNDKCTFKPCTEAQEINCCIECSGCTSRCIIASKILEKRKEKMSEQIKTTDYLEIPNGYYMCFINGCERCESKSGKPMLKVTLKINKACADENKDFEGRYMWVYQVTNTTIGQNLAAEWERIAEHFPTTPIKVSKFEREGKNGTNYTNYKPWLSEDQNAKLNA